MNTANLARTTFVLDRATADQLGYLSRRMGVSRSALVREVLAEPIATMAKLVEAVPDQPTPDDIRQLALAGLDAVHAVIDEPMGRLEDLSRG